MQACVLGDPSKPLTQTQYTEAQERAASVVQLGEVLPQVYGIVDCRFIDNAFNVIIADECSGLDDNSLGLAAAAFISAISLTLTTFYFCICIQCAPDPAPPPPPQHSYSISARVHAACLLCLLHEICCRQPSARPLASSHPVSRRPPVSRA